MGMCVVYLWSYLGMFGEGDFCEMEMFVCLRFGIFFCVFLLSIWMGFWFGLMGVEGYDCGDDFWVGLGCEKYGLYINF